MENVKTKLAESIKDLMQTEELDKITVAKVCENAHISRQSFYRNFRDKYDLVNWYFECLVGNSLKQMGISCTLREGLVKKFYFIKNEKAFFFQAFRSHDINSLKEYDYQSILEFYKQYLQSRLKREIDEAVLFSLKVYCYGSVAVTVEWVNHGMKTSPEEMAKLLIDSLPHNLQELFIIE